MSKNIISDNLIVETSAKLSNEVGIENLTLKIIAKELNIKSPSLYNHISNLDDIKEKIMIYGWKQIENNIIAAAVGVSGYEALRKMCYAFYDFAINNKGIFNAILLYSKSDNLEKNNITKRIFDMLFKVMKPLDISDNNIKNSIKTLISFLEGFSLNVNTNTLEYQISTKESFDNSLEIIIDGIKSLEEMK